jgi:hypothetical protein
MKLIGFVLLGVMMVGCGGGGDDDDGPVPPDRVGEELGQANCERLFDCCDAQELMDELGIANVDTVQECAALYAGFASSFFEPKIEAAIASGRLVYHADRMRACIAALEAMSCSESAMAMNSDFGEFTGCADPFEGQVPDGMPCADDMECQSDFCRGDSTDFQGNVTEGVCGPPPTAGVECDFSECATGFYCEFGATGQTCVAVKAAGAACDNDEQCQTDNCEGADPVNEIPGTCSPTYRCDGM